MNNFSKALLTIAVLVIGTPAILSATPVAVPEIDPSTGLAAMSLIAGTVLVIRGRTKK